MVKPSLMILSGLLGAMALTPVARASVTDRSAAVNPYRSIWIRNVFALKRSAGALVDLPNTDLPPANIKLTGITTILGDKKALFMVQAASAPGKPAGSEQSYILGEGQRRGALEVLAINPKAGTVQIRNDGILSTITFSSNIIASMGQKIAGATPVPHPGFGRTTAGSPGFIPGTPGETPRNFTVPNREPQTSYDPSQAAAAAVYYGGYVGGATAPVAAPTSPAPASGTQASTPTVAAPQPDVMSQAAAAIAQAQAQAAKQGRSLIPAALPVNETFTQFDGTTGTASTPTVSAPVPPESFTVPPVPNLPTPPALPDSLQPHNP